MFIFKTAPPSASYLAGGLVKTSIDLSSQGETQERFQPNFLSRGFVRMAMAMSQMTSYILPETWQQKIDKQFATNVLGYHFMMKAFEDHFASSSSIFLTVHKFSND